MKPLYIHNHSELGPLGPVLTRFKLAISGNTREMARDNRSKNWFFTFNNYNKSDIEILEDKFKEKCTWYVFQEEVGENGTPHLQGTIELKIKGRPIETFGYKEIHWEKTKKVSSAVDYCSKLKTRNGELKTNIKLPRQPKILKYEELYDWQRAIVDKCKEEPDDRTINWYWEPEGRTGKTALCKYLMFHENALLVSGKAENCKFAVISYKKTYGKYPDIILWNTPRCVGDHISYTSIEELKDGAFFSGKYESASILMPEPHIYVFANCPPRINNMSKDKWNIVELAASSQEAE